MSNMREPKKLLKSKRSRTGAALKEFEDKSVKHYCDSNPPIGDKVEKLHAMLQELQAEINKLLEQ